MALLIFGQANNREDQKKMAKRAKDFIEEHAPDGAYNIQNTKDGSCLKGDRNLYEKVDYTKPRDICHLEEDIQVFTDFYKQENPDCTLKEYLERELGNVEYYESTPLDHSQIIEAINFHL